MDANPVLIEFFESPVGTAFLHRLVTSAHVSFTKAGSASIHNVSDFLERAGLDQFNGISPLLWPFLGILPIVKNRMNNYFIWFNCIKNHEWKSSDNTSAEN